MKIKQSKIQLMVETRIKKEFKVACAKKNIPMTLAIELLMQEFTYKVDKGIK